MLCVFLQPTFGSKIVTPPDSHTPRPLLAPSLPDLSETGDGVASDDVRGSGVGSDVGDVEGRWRHFLGRFNFLLGFNLGVVMV